MAPNMTDENSGKWGTLLSCCLSCFVAWLDFAIVNTALPAIQTSLGASLVQLQWIMNAFLLALAVLIVMMGRISDHVGRKRMIIFGVIWFGLFSLFAGLAQSPAWLIICRFMQGLASAAIIPTSIALISHAFPGEEKAKAIGIWSGVTGLGMAIGPVLGGILVSALSWRWIFFINVPFCVISIILSLIYTKESRHETSLKPDYKGVCLLTLGLFSLIFGLMHAPDWGWGNWASLLTFAIAILVLFLFFYLEKRSAAPTIPCELIAHGSFLCATLVMFCLVFVFTAVLFLVPLYLIQVRGQQAYEAGVTILPITAAIALISFFMGPIMAKIRTKYLIRFGLMIFGLSTVLQAFITPDSSIAYLLVAFVCLGIGWGITRTPATTTAIAAAPAHFAGTASGALWTIQNTGGALSIAITITIFRRLSEGSTEAFIHGFHTAMWLLSAVTAATILTLYLKPQKK